MDPAGLGQKKPGPCALRWTPGHEEPEKGNSTATANPSLPGFLHPGFLIT